MDISLETSDSEPTSISAQHQQLQERGRSLHPESISGSRSRSKSPRPQTLPGLVKASNKTTFPTVIKNRIGVQSLIAKVCKLEVRVEQERNRFYFSKSCQNETFLAFLKPKRADKYRKELLINQF